MIVKVGNYRREGSRITISVDQELSRPQVDLVHAVLERHGMTEDRTVAVEIDEAETVVEYMAWDDAGKPYVDFVDGEAVLATVRSVIPNGWPS